jgi:leucyl-tRNA synthetase
MDIDFKAIEEKWQKLWEEKKAFEVSEDSKAEKSYVLEMYPYPSGAGLHMGHAFNYTIGDIFARFNRMKGKSVLYPMGYDSFGLPAENAAIKAGEKPKDFTEKAIKNFIKQQKELGLSYDWSRMLMSHDPKYYRWNQYWFLKFLEKGLVYRKKAGVNWCEKCGTVLANEQVHNGKCWRHPEQEVEIKQLEQWFLKTTEYADELLEKVEELDWPERIKTMQKNWIGKSNGVEIKFKINGKDWKIFTTRPDTIFGVKFMVVSSNHPELMKLVSEEQKEEVEKYVKESKGIKQEDIDKMEKSGVFTGSYAENPLTGEKIPVWAGNFVLADYGSGMVMAVPGHDIRDFDFAKKYDLEIKEVISGGDINKEAYVGNGRLVNSDEFDGLESEEAKEKISDFIETHGFGKRTVNYKLKDWLVSRQRYWGTPIPVVYCDKCGVVPLEEKDLPVELPEDVEFGKGNPLLTNAGWLKCKCPKCSGDARRETDTMDTFFDSSWYFLRYCDNKNEKEVFDKSKVEYWMPVDKYIGGAEHACMHLIYARFFTKALRDLGFLDFDEPFKNLFNQGMLHGEDGAVMSKSLGNVVLPEEVSKKYGIDTARLFLVSIASPDKDISWSSEGIEGSMRFVKKVFDFSEFGETNTLVSHKLNKMIREVEKDILEMKYNQVVIKIRETFESFERGISKDDFSKFIKVFSVICPHVSEEIWEKLGGKGFVSLSEWPEVDEDKIDEELEKREESKEKVILDVKNVLKIVKEKNPEKEVKKVYLYIIPGEIENYDVEEFKDRVGLDVKIFRVNDSDKYDPEGKAGKAKPGKPGIYVE